MKCRGIVNEFLRGPGFSFVQADVSFFHEIVVGEFRRFSADKVGTDDSKH